MRALEIAPAAQEWLADTIGSTARVLHVFERAANLINDEGRILSLVTSDIGPEPFAMVIATQSGEVNFAAWFEAGGEAIVQGDDLHIGPLAISTRNAELWQPRPRWEDLLSQPDLLKGQLPMLKELLTRHAPSGSFAPLLDESLKSEPSASTFETRFLDTARQPAQALRDGIVASDLDACRKAARGLAGLGSGLTPSGDDFMMGALYALWATQEQEQFVGLAEAIVESAIPHTVPLSAAWLEAAARGEAGQLWHALIFTLADPFDREALPVVARAIIRVGHSSGADALTGFLSLLTHL